MVTGLNRRDLTVRRFETLAYPGHATIPVELARRGYAFPPSQANFLLVRASDPDAVRLRLLRAGLIVRDGAVLATGQNRQNTQRDLTVHAETDAFRKAGRRRDYPDCVMVTTLSPCWYCSGLVRQFNIGVCLLVRDDIRKVLRAAAAARWQIVSKSVLEFT